MYLCIKLMACCLRLPQPRFNSLSLFLIFCIALHLRVLLSWASHFSVARKCVTLLFSFAFPPPNLPPTMQCACMYIIFMRFLHTHVCVWFGMACCSSRASSSFWLKFIVFLANFAARVCVCAVAWKHDTGLLRLWLCLWWSSRWESFCSHELLLWLSWMLFWKWISVCHALLHSVVLQQCSRWLLPQTLYIADWTC